MALEYKRLAVTPIKPVRFCRTIYGYAIDFGKVWFGTLRIKLGEPPSSETLTIRLGERALPSGEIDPNPPGEGRFRELTVELIPEVTDYRPRIPPDPVNTGPRTIKMPEEVGEVLPFRYVEIAGSVALSPHSVALEAVHYPYDEDASSFECSDPVLNAVWDLSKHSIIATSFCGIFVDGDRERYPREADAYINQLGDYCIDANYALARHTHEFMVRHTSRWTEWLFHSVLMAWADLLYSGNDASVQRCYNDLEAKLLLQMSRDDGLISTTATPLSDELLRLLYRDRGEHVRGDSRLVDIVDWPGGERDNYELVDYNTVVNSFHYRALVLMSRIALHTGRGADAKRFLDRAELVRESFQTAFFDDHLGLYLDGEGSTHASLHANLFPLVFGLVPEEKKIGILRFIRNKGMACSVYAAQYLLEALFREGQEELALKLITADGDRSWKHMLDLNATITFEAWDVKYKRNMDYNHPWGAAPANILPRYVLGVRPVTPGADQILVSPQPGPLSFVRGRVPIRQGTVSVDYSVVNGKKTLEVDIPARVTAHVSFGEFGSSVGSGIHRFCF